MPRTLIAIAASAAILSACGVAPVTVYTARPVPRGRIAVLSDTVPGLGKQEVVVERDKGFDGSFGLDARFYLDGRRVANLAEGEMLRLYLLPGQYRFGVQSRGGDASGEAVLSVSADIEPSKWPVAFRIRWVGSEFKMWRYTGFIIRQSPT